MPWFLKWKDLGRTIIKLGDNQFAFIPKDKSKKPTKFGFVRPSEGKPSFLVLRGRAYKKFNP